MIWLELFLGFLKVGCFSFGGAYSAIPLIREVVLSYGWIDDEFLSYMIAVSESTPGPVMVNLATYIGSTQGGILGAAIATLATILPAFLIIILITAVMRRFMEHKLVKGAMSGLAPCVMGVILAVGFYMILGTCCGGKSLHLPEICLTAVLALLYFGSRPLLKKKKKKLSPIALIIIAAVLGAVTFGFFPV